jgi:5-methyltetrahydropteroyltriglutamate--homocysteine methyltransferase
MQRSKPPFRADHVGSLLRPPALKEARAALAKGAIKPADLTAVEDREIERIVKKQEELGLQLATDGEFRRSWWHLDFLWGLGAERYQMPQGVAFAGVTTRPEGARIARKVEFGGSHPMIEHFKFLAAHTRVTPKMTIPAPSALYGRIGRASVSETAYPDIDQYFADYGRAYNGVARAFYDAGCRYLQLDEVMIAMLCDPNRRKSLREIGEDPDRLALVYADMINATVAGLPSDIAVTMHLCRGNYRSTYMGAGGYEAVEDILFDRIKLAGYFMEYDTARAGGFEPLRKLPKGKLAVLGIVTTKDGRLESKDEIKRRIDEAAKFADPDQFCLSGQCGFASTEEGNTLTEDQQWAKLARIVEVARDVWG